MLPNISPHAPKSQHAVAAAPARRGNALSWQRHTLSIRILLADDHAIVRDGLRALLERQPGFSVVAEAADGLQAVELAQRHEPDVAILDVAMPGLNGIEAARRILASTGGTVPLRTAVLMLSMHMDESYVLRSLKAGARGYLLKDGPREDILEAVRAAK
jgi:DNA-binding NarL/FixJ family response regulator